MSDPRVLRYDPKLYGDDVFTGARRARSSMIDLTLVLRVGDRRRTFTPLAVVYGMPAPPPATRPGLPLSLARGDEDVWHLEECWLGDGVPRSSYLLVGLPRELGDDWSVYTRTREATR